MAPSGRLAGRAAVPPGVDKVGRQTSCRQSEAGQAPQNAQPPPSNMERAPHRREQQLDREAALMQAGTGIDFTQDKRLPVSVAKISTKARGASHLATGRSTRSIAPPLGPSARQPGGGRWRLPAQYIHWPRRPESRGGLGLGLGPGTSCVGSRTRQGLGGMVEMPRRRRRRRRRRRGRSVPCTRAPPRVDGRWTGEKPSASRGGRPCHSGGGGR